MTDYTSAKTEFVRSAIRQGQWQADRERIRDYLAIERYCENPPGGFGGGYHFGHLRISHPRAYLAIKHEMKTGQPATEDEITALLEEHNRTRYGNLKIQSHPEQLLERYLSEKLDQKTWQAAGGQI
jgi:hypothetical protein